MPKLGTFDELLRRFNPLSTERVATEPYGCLTCESRLTFQSPRRRGGVAHRALRMPDLRKPIDVSIPSAPGRAAHSAQTWPSPTFALPSFNPLSTGAESRTKTMFGISDAVIEFQSPQHRVRSRHIEVTLVTVAANGVSIPSAPGRSRAPGRQDAGRAAPAQCTQSPRHRAELAHLALQARINRRLRAFQSPGTGAEPRPQAVPSVIDTRNSSIPSAPGGVWRRRARARQRLPLLIRSVPAPGRSGERSLPGTSPSTRS